MSDCSELLFSVVVEVCDYLFCAVVGQLKFQMCECIVGSASNIDCYLSFWVMVGA